MAYNESEIPTYPPVSALSAYPTSDGVMAQYQLSYVQTPTIIECPSRSHSATPSEVDADDNDKHQKRKQVKSACSNCQKACKKCDTVRPCPRCIRYGIQDSCMDTVRKERNKGIKRGPYKRKNYSPVDFGVSSSVYSHPNPANIRSSVASSQAGTPCSSPMVDSFNTIQMPSQATYDQRQYLYPDFIASPQRSQIPSSTAPPPTVLVPSGIKSNSNPPENDTGNSMDFSPLDILSQLCTVVLETPLNSPSTTPNVTAPSSPRTQPQSSVIKQEESKQSEDKVLSPEVHAVATEPNQNPSYPTSHNSDSSPSKQSSSKFTSPKKQRKPYSPRKATKAAAEMALAAAAALKESKKNHFPWTPAFVAAAESAMAQGIRPPPSKPQMASSASDAKQQVTDLPAPPPPVAIIKNLAASTNTHLISAPSSPARESKRVQSTPIIPSLPPPSSLMVMMTPESTPGRGTKPVQTSSTS